MADPRFFRIDRGLPAAVRRQGQPRPSPSRRGINLLAVWALAIAAQAPAGADERARQHHRGRELRDGAAGALEPQSPQPFELLGADQRTHDPVVEAQAALLAERDQVFWSLESTNVCAG